LLSELISCTEAHFTIYENDISFICNWRRCESAPGSFTKSAYVAETTQRLSSSSRFE